MKQLAVVMEAVNFLISIKVSRDGGWGFIMSSGPDN